jgi:mRNA-degrading endonuclease RelE of RelBE toxin-antitoxin system
LAWQIAFSPEADKALAQLGAETQKRIVRFYLYEKTGNIFL